MWIKKADFKNFKAGKVNDPALKHLYTLDNKSQEKCSTILMSGEIINALRLI
jgi:hypothetical protein